ncbi:ABC transporter permease [Aquibacillus sp. 3ASR75-11]|uniref:ABC transporter permease n=1 Tax=Terrihalobacillus insolitus TaxID=2950438 RepID=A0A9X3WSY2_9BACI|nr:ABC transporter permease subunit [Terrihalobacillus insolitus]MDC3413472.1 ABC transporter permease [Terrihalobacillus insolitus]MDC3425237.1 ABC transporter permease [Terrihalobacillus insolitus]
MKLPKLSVLKEKVEPLGKVEVSPKLQEVSAFFSIVRKEFTDYILSWRIIILLAIIALTSLGSLYTAISTIKDTLSQSSDAQEIAKSSYLFLKLFTVSDGTLPPFITFVTFLGPLLGISLGFDAINSERNKGTLSRLMAQPIPRDYVLNAKFVAALLINIVLFFTLGFLVMGLGILIIGIPPSFEEFMRIIYFLILCIAYISFWLNLGILFSVQFKQAATSALSGIAVWIFFSLFYSMIINVITKGIMTSESLTSTEDYLSKQGFILNLMRLSPNYLFSESTTTLLSPSVRSLGPLTMEQTAGAVAGPLPLSQSLLLIWPQLTGLIAATLICFAISYILFMRQEIRTN